MNIDDALIESMREANDEISKSIDRIESKLEGRMQKLEAVARTAKKYNKQHSASRNGEPCYPDRDGKCVCGLDVFFESLRELSESERV